MASTSMFSSPADPTTPEGQQVGAILVIKRTSSTGPVKSQIGDLVKVLSHAKTDCKVFNNRQKITESIPWAILLPLAVGMICGCVKGQCRCVKEDPIACMVSYPSQIYIQPQNNPNTSPEIHIGSRADGKHCRST